VLPGLVDLHAHFREPGQEHKEDIASGLSAAVKGGFVAVCAMPNTRPVNDRRSITEAMVARARECGGARLLPVGAMTRGLEGREITEMGDLREAGAVAVSDDGRCVMDASVMRRAMEYARTFDLLVIQHCEDHPLTLGAQMHEGAVSTRLGLRGWPREAEDVIVARDLLLAERTGARYHVAHVSSMGAVRLLREAKARGLRVSAEVTPHHLTLTDEAVVGYRTECKVNPPLRSPEDRAALREALADGTIDCIATDHAPHDRNSKDCEFDAAAVGINGLETAVPVVLSLVHEGFLTPLRFADAMGRAAARLVPGLEAGSLKPGCRADVTVLDPDLRWTLRAPAMASKSHNSPWLETELRGVVTRTLVAGSTAYERGGVG
jgi:dihydroorotase